MSPDSGGGRKAEDRCLQMISKLDRWCRRVCSVSRLGLFSWLAGGFVGCVAEAGRTTENKESRQIVATALLLCTGSVIRSVAHVIGVCAGDLERCSTPVGRVSGCVADIRTLMGGSPVPRRHASGPPLSRTGFHESDDP